MVAILHYWYNEENFGDPGINNMRDEVIPPDMVRIYRLESDSGYGPVPRRKVKTSIHSIAIQQLLRDLNIPPWMRTIIGRKSPASAATHREDWVFGITNFNDLRAWTHSWLGKGCALSVYDVPRALVVEGEGEVLFWRGAFQGPLVNGARRSHPSGLAPLLQERIPEVDLVQLLESVDAPGVAVEALPNK